MDAYAPHLSTIWGVADYARSIGTEVIINGNTLESTVDQTTGVSSGTLSGTIDH